MFEKELGEWIVSDVKKKKKVTMNQQSDVTFSLEFCFLEKQDQLS